MLRGYSLRNGILKIAGRVVARDVMQAKLVAAVISLDADELRAKYGSRNVVAFTLTGRRVWQIQPPEKSWAESYVGLGGSPMRPTAYTFGGWVYDVNASDGSIWYLRWVK